MDRHCFAYDGGQHINLLRIFFTALSTEVSDYIARKKRHNRMVLHTDKAALP